MKSLLVEALRQAGQTGEPSATEDEPAAEPAPTLDSEPIVPEVDTVESSLELIDDGQVDSTDMELTAGTEESSSESLTISEQPAASELETLSPSATTLPQDVAAGADVVPVDDQNAVASTTTAITARPDLLLRAGRLSPLLYALTVTAAAASLTGYQRLNTDDMNVELGLLRERPVESSAALTPREGWQALAAERVTERSAAPLEKSGGAKAATGEPQSKPASADRWTTSATTPTLEDPALGDVRDAYNAYRRGDYAVAEARYRDALSKDPYHLHGLLGLAAVYERTERHDDAQALYRRVLTAHPNNADAASRLIATITRSGPFDAETRLKLLVQQYGETPSIRTALGSLLAEQERWPEAFEAFSIALQLQPEDADAHYNVAVSAERIGRLDSAHEHYAAALSAASPASTFERQDVESRLAALSRVRGSQP